MDEVFGTLDEVTRINMNLMLRNLHTHTMHSTILFVTHSIDEAVLLGDRVLVFGNVRDDQLPQTILYDLPIDLPDRTKETRHSEIFDGYKRKIEDVFDRGLQ